MISIALMGLALGYHQARGRWAYYRQRAEHFAFNEEVARAIARAVRDGRKIDKEQEGIAASSERLAEEYARKRRSYESRW